MSWRSLPICLLLVSTAACDSSSPTEPAPPAVQAANIVFTNPQALSAHRAAITELVQQTLDRVNTALPLGVVQVTVNVDPRRTIPGWGLGGYALGPGDIEIVVDPDYPGLGGILDERLPPLVAHEAHHVVRIRGPGYGMTLLENMISEGLADHFAVELLGAPIPPWSDAFGEDETQRYLNRARPEFDSTTFDFNAWFFGIGTDLPQWTGYTLGFRLVRDYLSRNPGSDAAGLVNTPGDAFRP